MARNRKYGRVTTEFGGIPADEPVMIIRYQDKLLPEVIEHYRELCEAEGSPREFTEDLKTLENEVEDWQSSHTTKIPGVR